MSRGSSARRQLKFVARDTADGIVTSLSASQLAELDYQAGLILAAQVRRGYLRGLAFSFIGAIALALAAARFIL